MIGRKTLQKDSVMDLCQLASVRT